MPLTESPRAMRAPPSWKRARWFVRAETIPSTGPIATRCPAAIARDQWLISMTHIPA